MSSWRCGFLFCALLLATVPTLCAREAAVGPDAPPLMPPAGVKLDPAKLPGDATIVLTPKELQDLLDKARREGRTKLAPTECRLGQGRVEGGFVLFEAGFDFHAEQKDAVFALACRQAKVTAVTKDKGDRTPILSGDADGYYVQGGTARRLQRDAQPVRAAVPSPRRRPRLRDRPAAGRRHDHRPGPAARRPRRPHQRQGRRRRRLDAQGAPPGKPARTRGSCSWRGRSVFWINST